MAQGIRSQKVELDEVDLIRGTLGLHSQTGSFARDCRCGRIFDDEAAVRTHVAEQIEEVLRSRPINVVFDGPPSHASGRFVEVETDDGRSINAGEWRQRDDGLWSLRITALPKED